VETLAYVVCATVGNLSKKFALGQNYEKEHYTSTESGAKLELLGKEVVYLFFRERRLILRFHQWNHA